MTNKKWQITELNAVGLRAIDARADAYRKAIDALSRYKFEMFGYWASKWVSLNHIINDRSPNPFRAFVQLARSVTGDEMPVLGCPGCDSGGELDHNRVPGVCEAAIVEPKAVERESIMCAGKPMLGPGDREFFSGRKYRCSVCQRAFSVSALPNSVYWFRAHKSLAY